MTPVSPEISVVAPVHNEEGNLPEFHRRLTESLQAYGRSYELVLVDDGSSDGSQRILRELAEKDGCLRVLTLSRNCGQWVAVYAGMQNSRGRHVVVMDSDLQHDPAEIPLLVDKAREGYDLVSGWRQARSESMFLRRAPSLIANWLIRTVTKCQIHDMGGFKCLGGEWARQLHLTPGSHRFLPALVFLRGGSVAEVPISAPPRLKGQSHYGIERLPNVALDIMALWFQAAYLGRPLHLLGKLAALLFGGGSLLFAWLVYEKIVNGVPMGSRPLLTVSVLGILLGVQCLILGLLADVISRIYYSVRNQRPYHIKSEFASGNRKNQPGPPGTGSA